MHHSIINTSLSTKGSCEKVPCPCHAILHDRRRWHTFGIYRDYANTRFIFIEESADNICKTYNSFAAILKEKGPDQVSLKCDICAELPYAIWGDLDMNNQNMHCEEFQSNKKLELDAAIAGYYLKVIDDVV